MGNYCHHAILVSTWDVEALDRAQAEAARVFPPASVSLPIISPVNGIRTFMVAPDGSKEGWEEDFAGDEHRAEFVAWLREQVYEDGSGPLDWVEVYYGNEAGPEDAAIVQTSA